MKKNIFISIVLGLCLCITGCGKQDGKSSTSGKQKLPKATSEILEADIDSQKVQLGNTVITLPILINELLKDTDARVVDINPETEIVDQESSKHVSFDFDGWVYEISCRNNNSERQLLKDCIIDNVNFLYGIHDYYGETYDYYSEGYTGYKNIIYPKGIKCGTSFDDLKKAYGEPTDSDIDKHYYVINNSQFDINIDLESKTIENMSFIYTGQTEDQD